MRKSVVASMAVLAMSHVTGSFARDVEAIWLQVAQSATATYEADVRTLRFVQKGDGSIVIGIVGRETTVAGKINVSRWAIAADSCEKGSGPLFIADIKGENQHANAFSAAGKTIASEIGTQLCQLYGRKVRPVE